MSEIFDKNKFYHNEVIIPTITNEIIKYKKYSLLNNSRLSNLINICKNLKFQSGIAMECGVANGGSLQIIRNYLNDSIIVYGLDSFSNMPQLTDKDEKDKRALHWVNKVMGNEKKCLLGFSENKVSDKNLKIIKGFFSNTIPENINNFNNIVLLRLDADWYEATYYLLDNLYDKVVTGGIVIIDDFYAYIGCRKAVIDFFNSRGLKLPYIYHTKEEGLTTITGGTEVYWYKN
jgi:O-methyltransferase